MKPEREQTEKKNAEWYLVVVQGCLPMTVWAENFTDVLNELMEDDIVISENEIISITRMEFREENEE